MLTAVSKDAAGQIFNVESEVGTKFKDMVGIVLEVAGGGEELWFKSALRRPREDFIIGANIKRWEKPSKRNYFPDRRNISFTGGVGGFLHGSLHGGGL